VSELLDQPVRRARKKRRADGTLRPAVIRYRRSQAFKKTRWKRHPERAKFFAQADTKSVKWVGEAAEAWGMEREQAAERLGRIAKAAGWLTLVEKGALKAIGGRVRPKCGQMRPTASAVAEPLQRKTRRFQRVLEERAMGIEPT
jgi:hypothetical protein